MSEHLVPYVEPRLRKPVTWVVLAVGMAAALGARFLFEYDPILTPGLMVATFALFVIGSLLVFNVWVRASGAELITRYERIRRYQIETPFWEMALSAGAIFGVTNAMIQLERMDTWYHAGAVLLVCGVVGGVGGIAVAFLNRWSARRVAQKHRQRA